ncbi:MAG TPA: ATP-grasp fold amidoligase family protein [Spirochaetota bacterium]|nr:ATP-grasp fold amidoligase family protein [Spirochaetota bacterium]
MSHIKLAPVGTFTDIIYKTLYCDKEARDMRNVTIADKIQVQSFVENIIGKDTGLFDTRIWGGYNVDEAMENIKIPCVVKANNAWRRMKFIDKKSDITKSLRSELNTYMTDIRKSWEWYYQLIKPGILIEEKLPAEHILYRVYVFGGKARLYFIQRFNVENKDWDVRSDSFHYANGDFIPVTWNNFPNEVHQFTNGLNEKLNKCAEAIAQFPGGPPPYLRVDLYHIYGRMIFSELTMLPDAATGHYNYFNPKDIDFEMGGWYEEAIKKGCK